MNVLEVIQAAAIDIGITVPSVAAVATDPGTRQLVGLLNKEGRELSRRYWWQALSRECTFTTVATEVQGTLAAIVGSGQAIRDIRPETMFNRTSQQPVYGPLTPTQWQAIKADNAASPYNRYRIMGNQLLMAPTPTAGETVAFEYVTKCWLTDSGGTTFRTAIAADTDVLLLDDEVMLKGLIWRWKKAKNFEYGEDFKSYEMDVADLIGRDGTKPRLSLADSATAGRGIPTIPRMIGS